MDHYENDFRALSPLMINGAENILNEVIINGNSPKKRICFFIFSLANDLAHTEFLSQILKEYYNPIPATIIKI